MFPRRAVSIGHLWRENILNMGWICAMAMGIPQTSTIYSTWHKPQFFTKEEKTMLITSLFYSKLYYGSEVWHLPGRTATHNNMIMLTSANALRIISNEITIYHTHTEIHRLSERALPEKMCLYRHAVIMYKLFNNIICENEFLHLNFQIYWRAEAPLPEGSSTLCVTLLHHH